MAGDSSGQDTPGTQTITELRRAFGGRDEGYVGSPFGSKHRLSLQPWAGQDPQRTRLAFSFTGREEDMRSYQEQAEARAATRAPRPAIDAAPTCPVAGSGPPGMEGISGIKGGDLNGSGHWLDVCINGAGITGIDGRPSPDWYAVLEAARATIPCPLCGASLRFASAPVEYVRQIESGHDGHALHISVRLYHPAEKDLAQTVPPDYPFTVVRYRRIAAADPGEVRNLEPDRMFQPMS